MKYLVSPRNSDYFTDTMTLECSVAAVTPLTVTYFSVVVVNLTQ